MGGIERTCAIGIGHRCGARRSREHERRCRRRGRRRVGGARGGFASAAVEQGGETPHRGGELPRRGVGLGSGTTPRCSHQCVVPGAASLLHDGGHRRGVCSGGGRGARAGERDGAREHGDRAGRRRAGHCRPRRCTRWRGCSRWWRGDDSGGWRTGFRAHVMRPTAGCVPSSRARIRVGAMHCARCRSQ